MKAIDLTGLVDKLQRTRDLTDEEFSALLSTGEADAELFDAAERRGEKTTETRYTSEGL